MKQPTLLDPRPAEYTIPEEPAPTDTALSVVETQPPALKDFRQQFLMAPVAVMQAGLAEYKERRESFREWLKSQLVEGVHYGYPPGCEPKYCDQNGRPCPESEAWGTVDKKNNVLALSTWTPKPSFYKAGADFVCDLLWARDEYEADMNAWEQLGKPVGTFVFRCRLLSRATNEVLGEGRGCRRISTNRMTEQENGAIKMAKKSAKVDAVLNTWGLADLFTQDIEDGMGPEKRPSPEADPNAATAQPRGERVTAAEIEAIVDRWKRCVEPGTATAPNWKSYVLTCSKREFDPLKAPNWSKADFDAVDEALKARGA
jgi:hypothetical protein